MPVALRLVLFLVTLVVVWGGGHYYVGRRLIDGSRLRGGHRRAAWGILAGVAALPLYLMVGGRVGAPAGETLRLLGFVAMGFSSLLVTFTLLAHAISALSSFVGNRAAACDAAPDPGRRLFLQRTLNAGVAGGAATLTAAGYASAIALPDVVRVKVPIANLPAALEGFRIVQLSDIHVGPTIRGTYLEGLVELANAQDADVAAVTGDLIDGFVADLRADVAPLSKLRARHGAYFVTGNHEYYWNGPAWCAYVGSLGLTVLNNEHRVVEHGDERVVIAGATDRSGGNAVAGHASDPVGAMANAPDGFRLMLIHQPRSAEAAREAGADLAICGHTHGGQYFPMNIFVHLFQPFVAGLHRVGRMWLYVSRGSGYWGPPNRLGAPSEVTVLELTRA